MIASDLVTALRRFPARAPAALAVLAIVALVAACAPSSGSLGTPELPSPTAQPSVEPASGDVTPAPSASGSPSPLPGGSGSPAPTGTPAASPTATPAGTTIVRAYFVLGSFTGNEGLVPVLREVPKTQAVATAAMKALLAGPQGAELAGRPAMYTAVPDGTSLLGISIDGGVATVNLSREFESGGGSASVLYRLAQVTYTLTQFPTVTSVRFELDGQPVSTFGGEGVILDHPVARADYRDQLPAIFVDRPAWGAALGNGSPISGLANVFEAAFVMELRDEATGSLLSRQPVMASCGTGCWGEWKGYLPYSVTKAQWATLRVYDLSAKDGSVENLTEYRVWISPD